MRAPTSTAVYTVDAGGSRTVVAVWRESHLLRRWERESFAIASAGEATARQVLENVLREIREILAAQPSPQVVVGCLASSSMPVADEARPPASLIDVLREHAPAGRLVLVNDVVPLLWSRQIGGMGVIACSGTGSSVIGRGPDHRVVKVGGHEHIVSDQGSAYSLAREGLRAAARDLDGTGPVTKLRAAAESFFRMPIPALGRWLAEAPRARTTVASFAPCVTAAGDDGDQVAGGIVAAEAAALAGAATVAASEMRIYGSEAIGLAGGVLRGSATFRQLVEEKLADAGLTDPARSNIQIVDGLEAGAEYAARLLDASAQAPDGVVLDV